MSQGAIRSVSPARLTSPFSVGSLTVSGLTGPVATSVSQLAVASTYRFDSTGFTDSLHCNYYSNIRADDTVTTDPKNVAVRFGSEFKFLNQPLSIFTSADLSGYSANSSNNW